MEKDKVEVGPWVGSMVVKSKECSWMKSMIRNIEKANKYRSMVVKIEEDP